MKRAAPPQEGDIVGGGPGAGSCSFDPATQTSVCSGGSGGHLVGSQAGNGGGGHSVTTSDETVSRSGGGGGGSPESGLEPGGVGEHCTRLESGKLQCVGGGSA